jgi:hypothetical protein
VHIPKNKITKVLILMILKNSEKKVSPKIEIVLIKLQKMYLRNKNKGENQSNLNRVLLIFPNLKILKEVV